MESKPCRRVFFLIRQINGRMDYILDKTTTYKINMYKQITVGFHTFF